MNMTVPAAISATPNGTTRPQVRIVIVGHVDHGKSTLVGRLLHETGSLPEGKLEMLKAVSARRGMPFEWSFLLDALQTERDQGITIDTTQIRFRTESRDVVLIDAPGHAEFLRNMITGASQADGALLIIDALEGVRDQTRRHGYLLHLLGVKQVAVVVNKMDRVDFSAARFDEISDEISAHLTGLGVTPSAVIPISARDGDGVAERTPQDRLVRGPDRGRGARCARAGAAAGAACAAAAGAGDLQVRRPPHRRGPHRIRPSRRRRRDRHHARRQDREDQERRGLAGDAGQGRADARDDRSASRSTANCSSNAATSSPMSEPARATRAGCAPASSGCTTSRSPTGASILVRLGTREIRATVVAIEKAVDPGELSSVETKSIARNHVGEIDISLAQPIAADPYTDNPRTGRLVIEVNGRIAGGGLVLSVDAGQRAIPVDIVPVESALRPDERSARYRHNGAVVWLTGLPGSGKSTLARALERRLFGNGGSPVLLDGDTLRAGLNSDLGFSAADRTENIRRLAEVATHLARNGHIAIVAAVSPSREDRAAARRIADTAFREIYVATPAEVCESRDPKGHYAKARAGALPAFTGIGNDYQPPTDSELTLDTSARSVSGGDRRDRADADEDRRSVRRSS